MILLAFDVTHASSRVAVLDQRSSTSLYMTSFTRYGRRFSSISTKSGAPVIDHRHMLESSLSSLRKRRRSESNETLQPIFKKQRLNHPGGSQSSALFWNNLSKIWLTKRALRELDRRNNLSAFNTLQSPYPQARRPITRNFLAESKRSCRNGQYAADYLRCCRPRILRDIKRSARHGGPDLSGLRNACIARYLPACLVADERSLVPRTSPSFRSHNVLKPAEFSESTTGFYSYTQQ
jgi:hypothetical protein